MKRYHVYRMNFGSDWLRRSAMCMGMSIFLLAAYYLGMHDLAEFTGGHLFLNLWLPLVLAIGFVVLLCVVKWDAPGLYAIVCAVFCLVYLLQAVTSGNGFRLLLGIPGYLLCGAIYIVVVGGFFPSRIPSGLVFLIAIVARVVLFDLWTLTIDHWIAEGITLCSMGSFLILPMGLKHAKKGAV